MEERIINSVRGGNSNAFAYLVKKYKAVAYSIALKIVKNEQDAEEIVQDAFVKAYQKLGEFKGKARFSTWFYKIIYNRAISKARLKTPPSISLEEQPDEPVDVQPYGDALQSLHQADRKRYIQAALQTLDGLDYTLLTLFYYRAESIKSIGYIIEKDSDYVKMRLHRARSKLYHKLKQILKEEIDDLL